MELVKLDWKGERAWHIPVRLVSSFFYFIPHTIASTVFILTGEPFQIVVLRYCVV
jgi:hypothetical protein